MTKVDHFSSINHYLHSTNCKRLNFVTGWINLHLNVSRGVYLSWPFNSFRTFDASRYSHHLLHFAWTALLLILKAKVVKILWDQLSVNMAARTIFGHVTWFVPVHVHEGSRKLLPLRLLCKNKKKTRLVILFENWIGWSGINLLSGTHVARELEGYTGVFKGKQGLTRVYRGL